MYEGRDNRDHSNPYDRSHGRSRQIYSEKSHSDPGKDDTAAAGVSVKRAQELRQQLGRIDHRGYPAYKDLAGRYDFGNYVLSIDHVQGDPFAAPSSLSIHITGIKAAFPAAMRDTYAKKRALEDHLIRLFAAAIDQRSHLVGGSGKSGEISCVHPGQEVLERSACQMDAKTGSLVFRLYVGFPAAGRTILAGNLEKILFEFLPACAGRTLFYQNMDQQEQEKLQTAVDLAEDQAYLRAQMKDRGLVAFVANGAILPRESGISQKPMRQAIPFRSPAEDETEITLPHRGPVRGMGIPRGITLIIGGGYHGKSTLLEALEKGVYDHIAGDGRELVLCDDTAMKIRAEDGRCVVKDDIYPFIRNLPDGTDTHSFSSLDASGSTSQAASVTEAIESDSMVLLMDEDTCATNFMVRDELMQEIVSPEEEPIIPYSRIMRPLYEEKGISTILVAGSSGAFFYSADRILQMDHYKPKDVTARVRTVLSSRAEDENTAAGSSGSGIHGQMGYACLRRDANDQTSADSLKQYPAVSDNKSALQARQTQGNSTGMVDLDFSHRCLRPAKSLSDPSGRVKIKGLGKDGFMINHDTVDLYAVEQIADGGQCECIARMLLYLSERMDGTASIQVLIAQLMEEIRVRDFRAFIRGNIPGNLTMPRRQELFAAVDRCRTWRN